MLTSSEVRKLIRPYTVPQVEANAPPDGMISTQSSWGNAIIMIFKPAPREFWRVDPCSDVAVANLLHTIETAEKRQIWLTAIGEAEVDGTQYHVAFEDREQRLSHVDGRYVSLIYKAAGKGAKNIVWNALDIGKTKAVLASVLDTPLAVVAELEGGWPSLWLWELRNTDLPCEKVVTHWTEPVMATQVAMAF